MPSRAGVSRRCALILQSPTARHVKLRLQEWEGYRSGAMAFELGTDTHRPGACTRQDGSKWLRAWYAIDLRRRL